MVVKLTEMSRRTLWFARSIVRLNRIITCREGKFAACLMHANALGYARVLYSYQRTSNIVVALRSDSYGILLLRREYAISGPTFSASTNTAFHGLRMSVGCLMILPDAASRVDIRLFRRKVDLDAETKR